MTDNIKFEKFLKNSKNIQKNTHTYILLIIN